MKDMTRCSVAIGDRPAHCRTLAALTNPRVSWKNAAHPLREAVTRAQREPLRNPARNLAIWPLRCERALLRLRPKLSTLLILRSHGATAFLADLDWGTQTEADITRASKADCLL
jgi:hypothetical protein